MFYLISGALVFLVMGWDRLENVPVSVFQDGRKINALRYGKYPLVFLLWLFLPASIPLAFRILLWSLLLVGFLINLAEDFMPSRADKILAFLDPKFVAWGGKRHFGDPRIQRELDAVAGFVQTGNKRAALKLCDKLAGRGDMSPAMLAMVRGYLEESPAQPPGKTPASVHPPAEVTATVSPEPTIDQLIAEYRYGTAAEVLQREINARPGDFELFMKYVNLLSAHCGNPHAAVRALRQAVHRRRFSPEQIEAAGRQLLQLHPNVRFGDEGVTLLKNRKKPHPKKPSELL